jgi:hypothetical protein
MAFNGLLQGVMQGISAGAKGGAEVAKGYYEDERKIDVYKAMADIEMEKNTRLEELRSNLATRRKGEELEMERTETVKRGTDKEYLKAERNLASAKHFESAASLANARLAEMDIRGKEKVQSLIDIIENPKSSVEQKASAVEGLKVRGVIKPGEFDTEKVTTEMTDPETGAVTKTERTQKRQAVPGAAQTPTGGAAKPWEKAWTK